MNTCLFRYDPELDGRILLGKVDCTQEPDLCRRYFPDLCFLVSWFHCCCGSNFRFNFLLETILVLPHLFH